MSIASQISRIAGNVSAALLKIASKGVTVPTGANSDDLADLIDEIPVYDDVTATPGIIKSGMSDFFNSGSSGDNDVSLTPKYSNQEGHIDAHTDEPGTPEYYKIKTTDLWLTGGELISNVAYASTVNATTSTSVNNSGVEFIPHGRAGRNSIIFSSDSKGWIDYKTGETAMSDIPASEWDGSTYYINGVTINKPSSGTRTFSITLPNGGNDTITLTVTVYANGDWSIE